MGASGQGRPHSADRFLIDRYLRDVRRTRPSETDHTPVPPPSKGRRDARTIRALVEPHLFFVLEVAGRLRSQGVAFEDLLAEGNIGLVEAAHRFDPDQRVRFLTYASWWIRKRILAFLARETGAVRLTRHARDVRRELRALDSLLRADLNRAPTPEELAHASGLKPETVRRHAGATLRMCSLDQPAPAAPWHSLADTLADRSVVPPEEDIERRRIRGLVRQEVARLPRRERVVVENRFGIDGREPLTFEELGALLGVSRERARQLEHAALLRLRRRMATAAPQRPAAPGPASSASLPGTD
jgi:RNA polymerase primary sigma factor